MVGEKPELAELHRIDVDAQFQLLVFVLPTDLEEGATLAEVESVHWLTIAEMRALPELLDSNRHFLDALSGREFAIDGLTPD